MIFGLIEGVESRLDISSPLSESKHLDVSAPIQHFSTFTSLVSSLISSLQHEDNNIIVRTNKNIFFIIFNL